MAYIGPLPAETFTSFATQEFSTSATTSYTLDHPVTNENELALFINNVRQQPGSGKAYTASGTALTLSAATASTDTMYAVFLGRALQTVNPADASVGTAKLAATSVTAAKLNNDIISGTTALAEEPADTDEFLLSDGGTLKRIDYSYIKGGAYEHIKTTTVSSAVTSVQFIHGSSGVTLDSSFGKYVLSFKNLITGTADQRIKFRITTDGSSFEDTGYYMAGYRGYSQGSSGQGSDVVYGTSPELMNGGTAILIPGQYSAYKIDIHGGKRKYKALCQRSDKVCIWRDDNRDRKPDYSGPEYKGMFGINIHRHALSTEKEYVRGSSAGCQVFKDSRQWNQFLNVCHKGADAFGNSFTYTLIEQKDL